MQICICVRIKICLLASATILQTRNLAYKLCCKFYWHEKLLARIKLQPTSCQICTIYHMYLIYVTILCIHICWWCMWTMYVLVQNTASYAVLSLLQIMVVCDSQMPSHPGSYKHTHIHMLRYNICRCINSHAYLSIYIHIWTINIHISLCQQADSWDLTTQKYEIWLNLYM